MPRVQDPVTRSTSPGPGGGDTRLAAAARALVRDCGSPVTLRLTVDDGSLIVDLVKIEPECRGHGLGSATMLRVLALADSWGVPLTLHALSLADGGPGPDQDALEAWYRRLGFVRTGAVSVMGLAEMRRRPRPACTPRGPAPHRAHGVVSSRRGKDPSNNTDA